MHATNGLEVWKLATCQINFASEKSSDGCGPLAIAVGLILIEIFVVLKGAQLLKIGTLTACRSLVLPGGGVSCKLLPKTVLCREQTTAIFLTN